MDPQVQASFIPKKPLTTIPSGSGGGAGLFYLISIFVFVVSLVAAGATFAYTEYLDSSVATKRNQLQLAQDAYEPGAIQDLVRLDQRIFHAKELLARHIAPSAVFALLETETLERVQFTSFSYEANEDGTFAISMDGQADSFATVALQSDQFGANRALSNVVFSGITVGEAGKISFSVSAVISQDALLYHKLIEQTPAEVIDVPIPETPAATTTPTL